MISNSTIVAATSKRPRGPPQKIPLVYIEVNEHFEINCLTSEIDPFPLKSEKLHNTALISNAGPMAFGLGGFRGHKTASEVKSEDVLSKEVSKRSCDTVKIVQLDEV